MTKIEVIKGDSPVILAQPHGGTFVPDDLLTRMTDRGRALADTDWHIDRLYEGLLEATIVRTGVHRYVIDANRDPEGVSLYPGQNTTDLCPTTDFDGRPLWQEGQAPSSEEIADRRDRYHAPYHAALAAEIERVKARHGIALVYDCHSIRSEIPFLFEGVLPLLNIGTNTGTTCASVVEADTLAFCREALPQDHVLNGRFKGGWTTRHYGKPDDGVHAIQMEIAQRGYMVEHPPWTYLPDVAATLRPLLKDILTHLDALARSGLLNERGDQDV